MPDLSRENPVARLVEDIGQEGLSYFIEDFTSLDGFEKDHGRLPDEVRHAWVRLAAALTDFRSAVRRAEHG